jgi:hypothetical protein
MELCISPVLTLMRRESGLPAVDPENIRLKIDSDMLF